MTKIYDPMMDDTIVRSKNIEIGGHNIYYREAGAKNDAKVILYHGFPGSSAYYRNIMARLADKFHVIAPDFLGFGNSDKPDPATYAYSFDDTAAALAASNMSDDDITTLENLISAMSNTPPNGSDEGDDIDRQFHLTIAQMSGNPVIEYTVNSLWRIRNELPAVSKVYASVCSSDGAARTAEHAEILDALSRRDPNAARLAMREHFHRLFESMLAATESSALEEVKRKIGEDRQRFLATTRI